MMRGFWKKSMACTLALLSALVCVGCRADGSVPSKYAVKRYVAELCDERVKIIKTENISESPREVDYTFSSKERDLEFTVRSYRMGVGIPTSDATLWYQKKIDDNYWEKVHEYYLPKMKEVFASVQEDEKGNIKVCSTEDIDVAAKCIYEANRSYREELQYNSEELMQSHPYCHLYFTGEGTENAQYKVFYGTDIDGSNDSLEKITSTLRKEVAQGIKDGELEASANEGLDEELSSAHASKLEHIYLDDVEMLYDNNESPYVYYGLITDDYAYSFYDYDAESYMMVCDCGFVKSSWGSPALVISEYVDHLGGTYEIVDAKAQEQGDRMDLESRWTIGDHTWVMTGKYRDSDEVGKQKILDVVVKRDGEKIPLTMYNSPDNRPLFSLTAEDFCKLFDLSYQVDEEAGAIYFESIRGEISSDFFTPKLTPNPAPPLLKHKTYLRPIQGPQRPS
ncbi:MAG: hypothetical protein K6E79_08910 [Pseudobutyrivibrio sp.]|nr:hypothetical protein [Pseudobutyrivibrio sp.]